MLMMRGNTLLFFIYYIWISSRYVKECADDVLWLWVELEALGSLCYALSELMC